ncbi:MAG: helix-turn-helix protein, partial [Actinomycetota bacterium]
MKDEWAEYLAEYTASMNAEELVAWERELRSAKADSRARDFGVAVREARAVLGLTQVDLAEKSGVQQREISRIEKCIANPTLKTVDKIMR